jgi:hypothetical protein
MYILFVVTVEECLVGGRVGSPNCSKQKRSVGVWAGGRRINIFMNTSVAVLQSHLFFIYSLFLYTYPLPRFLS